LERKAPPTFEIAVEMLERQRWVVHESVADTVDNVLLGRQPYLQVRTVDENDKVTITRSVPSVPSGLLPATDVPSYSPKQSKGWRATGQILPLPQSRDRDRVSRQWEEERSLDEPLSQSEQFGYIGQRPGLNGEEKPLYVYPYGISRHQLEEVIRGLSLPVVLTREIDGADAILALRSHLRKHANLRRMAQNRQVPIHMIKANTIPQMTRTLRQVLGMDSPETTDEYELGGFAQSGIENEIDALEEARLAVEQIVIPKGQPVELLPRSAKVRQMQHELVEHYRLNSSSFGDEPNRRLRIYPA
jgi:hypothetical protein